MVKRRMIHDCLWQSEGVASLTYRQRCLWIGLITTADDQGRAKAHPGIIRAAVFPFDDISQDEIAEDLAAIELIGMVLVYQVDGKHYYQVVKWWDYQKPQWVGPSDHPAPDGWKDRLRYHGKGHRVITENWNTSEKELPDDKGDLLPDELPLPLGKGKEEVKVKEREEAEFLERMMANPKFKGTELYVKEKLDEKNTIILYDGNFAAFTRTRRLLRL